MKNKFTGQTKEKTSAFYDNLVSGSESRGAFGMSKRFNTKMISEKRSTKKYFIDKIVPYISPESKVLDFGCGPGSFLIPIAPYCKEIIGIDISKKFIEECTNNIKKNGLTNAKCVHIDPKAEQYYDEIFDVIIMVDVIHHLEDIEDILEHLLCLLKSGGIVLIFEPNKLNPLMYLMHLLDENERGLLRVGSPKRYQKLLNPYITIEEISFSGLVIGPQSIIFDLITEILNYDVLKYFIGWLNPKIFISGKK